MCKSEWRAPIIDNALRDKLIHLPAVQGDAKYVYPTTNFASFYRRIKRGDHKKVKPVIPQPVQDALYLMLEPIWSQSELTPYEAIEIAYDTAAGHPFSCKKKALAPFVHMFMGELDPSRPVYVQSRAKTDEILDRAAIEEKGSRIIFVDPTLALMEEKRVFEHQNKLFQTLGGPLGVRVGISMYTNAEFHNLIAHHAPYPYHIYGDTLAQDLSNVLVEFVYELRLKFLPDTDFVKFVAKRIVRPLIVLINGQVVQPGVIATSGNNNVTVDNTVSYIALMMCVFYRLYKHNFLIEFYATARSHYSDDWLMSTYDVRIMDKALWRDAWNQACMILKVIKGVDDVMMTSFLSTVPVLRKICGRNYYVPVPERDKVLVSTYSMERRFSFKQMYERLLNFLDLFLYTEAFPILFARAKEMAAILHVQPPSKALLIDRSIGLE